MDITLMLVAIIVGVCTLLVFSNSLKKKRYLESLGYPMISPVFGFGSPPFAWHKVQVQEFYVEKHKLLGKTWTRYLGSMPTIVTIDPDLIKVIMVKNFDHFINTNSFQMPDDKMTLDVSKGEIWRALRKCLSPTFTSGKLKSMIRPMEEVADNLIKVLDKRVDENQVVEVKEVFQAYSLDTIASCAFGIDTKAQENDDNPILSNGRKIFSAFACTNWLMSGFVNLFIHCPAILKVVSLYPKSFENLFNITKDIVEHRKKNHVGDVGDFIARLSDILEQLEDPLTPDMIYAQGVLFFSAGFETTSNALLTLSYNLARNPHVQDNIYQEIQEVISASNGKIDHETINKMPYLEAAINESLRMFPPVTESDRHCNKDLEVNGIVIKKGTQIQMPIWASHYLEEFFPEPQEFRPERFLKGNIDQICPFTWRPFGGGNRNCIGQRFALSEMKICMAKLLNRFKLEMDPKTDLKLNKGSLAFLSIDQLFIKFSKRQN